MTVKIRLARGGSKKLPYYRVVVADVRSPRDGKFIKKVGTYNPLLPADSADRVNLKTDLIEYWLSKGAQPTECVAKFIEKAGIALPAHIKNKIEVRTKNQKARPTKPKKA